MKAAVRKINVDFIARECENYLERAKEYHARQNEFQEQGAMDAADQEILSVLHAERVNALVKVKAVLQAVNVPYALTGTFLEALKKALDEYKDLNETVFELLTGPRYRWHS